MVASLAASGASVWLARGEGVAAGAGGRIPPGGISARLAFDS